MGGNEAWALIGCALLPMRAFGPVGTGAALVSPPAGPVEVNAFGEEQAEIVPAKRAVFCVWAIATNGLAAADPVAAVRAGVGRLRSRTNEHGAAGTSKVGGAVSVGIAGQGLEEGLLLGSGEFFGCERRRWIAGTRLR